MEKTNKENNFLSFIIILTLIVLTLIFFLIPKVKLNGNAKEVININTVYKDKSIKSNLIKKFTITNNINIKKVGNYTIHYKYNSPFLKFNIIRKVKVKDLKKPIIILKGKTSEYYCKGEDYKELGYYAYDNLDGNITHKVKAKRKEDYIEYSVKDKALNKTIIKRKIIEKDKKSPNLILNGSNIVYVKLNNNYNDPFANAYDNCDKDLTKKIKLTGIVNTSKVGDYPLTYSVTDKSGNKQETKRIVKVRKPLENGVIYLTFDDGPKDATTSSILDILKEKNVKATFFVTMNGSDDLIRRIVNEGHSIGIHTATHRYDIIYSSVENFFTDIEEVKNRIYSLTNIKTNLLRFPGGSSNTISKKYKEGIMSNLIKEVINKGYQYYDWNIESGDSSFATNKDKLYQRVTSLISKDKPNVILMHDIKTYTKDALPSIIDYAKSNGYTFDIITKDTMMITQRVNN